MHRGQNPAAHPWRFIVPGTRVSLTAENQSLINSFRSAALTPQETETCLQSLLNLMTSSEEESEAQFLEVILALEENHLPSMASLLTSNSDRFLEIARNKNGSYRLQMLIGKSADVDIFFFDAILCRFKDVMTDKNASHVAIHGMRFFKDARRKAMWPLLVFHADLLARDRHGYIALNIIITHLDLGDPNLGDNFYRDKLLDKVASDALSLSYHAFGSFVVQHVLKHYGSSTTRKVASNLNGHFVELSLTNYGSRVVERLLRMMESRARVVAELLECEEDSLMMLASNEYGSFVVGEALRVTQHKKQFLELMNKLRPHHRLLMAHERTIAD